jgi:hypothetical protein
VLSRESSARQPSSAAGHASRTQALRPTSEHSFTHCDWLAWPRRPGPSHGSRVGSERGDHRLRLPPPMCSLRRHRPQASDSDGPRRAHDASSRRSWLALHCATRGGPSDAREREAGLSTLRSPLRLRPHAHRRGGGGRGLAVRRAVTGRPDRALRPCPAPASGHCPMRTSQPVAPGPPRTPRSSPGVCREGESHEPPSSPGPPRPARSRNRCS